MALHGVSSAPPLNTPRSTAAKPRTTTSKAPSSAPLARTRHRVGFSPEKLDGFTAHTPTPTAVDEAAIAARLVGPDGLTEHATTFDRRDVIRGWCEQLPRGAPIATIERLADDTLNDAAVVPRVTSARTDRHPAATQDRQADRHPDPRSAVLDPSLLDLERRLIRRGAEQRRDARRRRRRGRRPRRLSDPPRPLQRTGRAGRRAHHLRPGARRRIAPAGTGKTFRLDAARDAWQRCGHVVIGTALAARAGGRTRSQPGIPSHTIASLLTDLDQPDHGPLPANTVLVVDEAGMVGTRILARLLDHATPPTRKSSSSATPTNSPRSTPAGSSRGLGERLEPIRLTQNRRQHQAWERTALAQLRDGHIDDAVTAYHEHGRIHTPPPQSPPATRWSPTGGPPPSPATTSSCSQTAPPTSTTSTPRPPPLPQRRPTHRTHPHHRRTPLPSRRSDHDASQPSARRHPQRDRATIEHIDEATPRCGSAPTLEQYSTPSRLHRRRPHPPRLRHHHPQSPRTNRRPRPRTRFRHALPRSRLRRPLPRPHRKPHLPRRHPTTTRSPRG